MAIGGRKPKGTMMAEPEVLNPGDIVEDTLTGIWGVVVCIADWLYGCRRITIQPYGQKDGKPLEGTTTDEAACRILQRGGVKVTKTIMKVDGRPPAGGRDAPQREPDATRP